MINEYSTGGMTSDKGRFSYFTTNSPHCHCVQQKYHNPMQYINTISTKKVKN